MADAFDMPERATRIDFPEWDPNVPEPHLLIGSRTFLLFYKRHAEPDVAVIVEFHGCIGAKMSLPSDETLSGHRLWGKGLQYYVAHEVEESRWLAEVGRTEKYRSSPGWVASHHHYVFTFHDETVECLAQGFSATERTGSVADALAAIAKASLPGGAA
jgi:hypothetical protein